MGGKGGREKGVNMDIGVCVCVWGGGGGGGSETLPGS